MAETNFSPRLGEVFEVSASQVNLFRSINSPGYVIGDIAITPAGATYEWDGDSWNSISFGGGGGAAQTPWAQDIQGAGFDLLNVRDITATRHILAEGSLRVRDTSLIADEAREWYFLSEDAGLSLYSLAGGVNFKWFSISDPNEGMVLHGSYSFHASGFNGTELNISGAGVTFGGLAGTGGYLLIDGVGLVTKGTAASLAANTFTALQTITQASANAGILASTGYSLTGSNATSMLDLVGTWNTSGTPTAIKLNITNTASNAAAKLLDLQVGGTTQFSIRNDGVATALTRFQTSVADMAMWAGSGFRISSALSISWADSTNFSTTADVSLWRDAANTLALRNSTNAQTFNVYNTWTDASNYERFGARWASNILRLETVKAGSGASRELVLTANAVDWFSVNGSTGLWRISTSGHLLVNDNLYDIGASGATRPRNVFAAGYFNAPSIYVGGSLTALLSSTVDGVLLMRNNGASDFSRLQFGGATSGFGGVARDGAGLRIVTADSNTAHSFLDVSELRVATTKVIGAQRTGWSAATGGATRTTFDTTTVTLPQLAERMKALIDDFLVHGAIGA